jgi:hypothetical protein
MFGVTLSRCRAGLFQRQPIIEHGARKISAGHVQVPIHSGEPAAKLYSSRFDIHQHCPKVCGVPHRSARRDLQHQAWR